MFSPRWEAGKSSFFILSAPWGWCRNDHTQGFEPQLSLTLLTMPFVVNETDTFPLRISRSAARAVPDQGWSLELPSWEMHVWQDGVF